MDLLHGPLLKKIFLFAIPLAVSSILQQLFNYADLAVVGRFAGRSAMAAVGANSSIVNLFVTLFVGLSVGANVIIARSIGEGREDKIHDALQTSILVAIVSGFIILALGMIFSLPIHRVISTPEDVIDGAVLYVRIYVLFAPFIMLYNFGAAILRSKGDTKRPLLALTAGGIMNVILNLIFVIVFHMGVAGVAIATGISNLVSAVIVIYCLCKEVGPMKLDLMHLYVTKPHLWLLVRIGIPAGFQNMLFSISNVVIQSAVNQFGAAGIAGTTVAVNFDVIAYYIMVAFIQTNVTFIGQNYGAGNMKRCREIFWKTLVSCAVIVLAYNVLMTLTSPWTAQIFSKDPEVLEYALYRIRHVHLLQVIVVFYELTAGAMRGLGYSTIPAVITVFGTCLFRLFWVRFVFSLHHTYGMLVLCYPITWVLTSTMMCTATYICFRIAERKLKENGNKAVSL